MFARDLMVAAIAIGLGMYLLLSAVMNHRRTFEMRTPNYWSEVYGRTCARWLIGGIGFILLMLGGYILCEPMIDRVSELSKLENDDPHAFAIDARLQRSKARGLSERCKPPCSNLRSENRKARTISSGKVSSPTGQSSAMSRPEPPTPTMPSC